MGLWVCGSVGLRNADVPGAALKQYDTYSCAYGTLALFLYRRDGWSKAIDAGRYAARPDHRVAGESDLTNPLYGERLKGMNIW